MTGSEKQIAWATQIQARIAAQAASFLASADSIRASVAAAAGTDAEDIAIADVVAREIDSMVAGLPQMLADQRANIWIDRRDASLIGFWMAHSVEGMNSRDAYKRNNIARCVAANINRDWSAP